MHGVGQAEAPPRGAASCHRGPPKPRRARRRDLRRPPPDRRLIHRRWRHRARPPPRARRAPREPPGRAARAPQRLRRLVSGRSGGDSLASRPARLTGARRGAARRAGRRRRPSVKPERLSPYWRIPGAPRRATGAPALRCRRASAAADWSSHWSRCHVVAGRAHKSPIAMATPTPIRTIPASSSLLCSTRAPSRSPSSRPISDMATLTTAMTMTASAIETLYAPSAKPTIRLSMLRPAASSTSRWRRSRGRTGSRRPSGSPAQR